MANSASYIDWLDNEDYTLMKDTIKDLKVVNDAAERCIKDITEYRDWAQDTQHPEDILIVVNDHKDVFQLLRREALAHMGLK